MRSIRTKIIMLVTTGLFVACMIVFGVNSYITNEILYNSASDKAKLVCEATSSKFNSIFGVIEESVNSHANMIVTKLNNIELISTDGEERDAYLKDMKDIGNNHVQSVEGTLSVFLVFDQSLTSDGEPYGFYLHRNNLNSDFFEINVPDVEGEGVEQNTWWLRAKQSAAHDGVWVQDYYCENADTRVVMYVKPVYKHGVFFGVVGMELSYELFENQAEDIVVYDTGFVSVLDSDGRVVYHPKYEHGVKIAEKNSKFNEILASVHEDTRITPLIAYTVDDKDFHMCLCVLNNGMLMYVSAPDTEVFAQQRVLWNTILLVLALTIGATLAISFVFSSRITNPIKKLTNSAKKMVEGDLDTEIIPSTHDEIADMARSFEEVREKLKQRIDLLSDESRHDGLTGVGNKTALNLCEAKIDSMMGNEDLRYSVIFLDVNRLKVTNDVFGHMAGDDLIRAVALHLCDSFGSECVFRVGGDEFVVVLQGERANKAEEEIVRSVALMEKKTLRDYPDVTISCASGIASYDPATDRCFRDTFTRADRNMYLNKADSKNRSNPWQENEKGIKKMQIEKRCEILNVLSQSTEDYPYLLDFENKQLRFFGDAYTRFDLCPDDEGVCTLDSFISMLHPADRSAVSDNLNALINGEIDEHNMNYRWINRGGSTVWFNCRGRVVNDDSGNPFVMIGRASQGSLKHLFNTATGLFNRTKFFSDIKTGNMAPFRALMLVCIDNLSSINVSKGRTYGDLLIRKLGEGLEEMFGTRALYHMEKDRYVILLDTDDKEKLTELFEKIKTHIGEDISVSAAAVSSNTAYVDEENIYDHAKQLIKDNRSSGKGQLYFFTKEQLLDKLSAASLLGEIEESIKDNCRGFYLCYQPKISAKNYLVTGAEALLRYKSAERGNVFPDQFIPLLEKTGLINEVGLWVLDTALAQCKKWRETKPDFGISVNFSAEQLKRQEIVDIVAATLEKHGVPGTALTVELTETVQLDSSIKYDEIFEQFRNMGVKISIDDFGTGYANLSYLKKIHADEIKIDRFFVSDIKQDSYNYKVVSNIVDFAKKNFFTVCLEGVETPSELAVLEGFDVDLLQGYLFDRPVESDVFEDKYISSDVINEDRWIFFPELHKHRSKVHIFRFDAKDILSEIDIGLWVINTDAKGGEMFTDLKMRELLGIDDEITPDECYKAWKRGIPDKYVSVVESMFDGMANSTKVMQVEYLWNHPTRGEIVVRCTGKCVRRGEDGSMTFEGFHRVISDMGGSYGS